MEEILRLSISEARARLPELAQLVMEAPGRAIIIEHRDFEERLVLTTESSIKALETTVKNTPTAPVFKLAGSMTSDLSDDELEAAMIALRQRSSEEAARRIASFELD
jgi:hypothetical protein